MQVSTSQQAAVERGLRPLLCVSVCECVCVCVCVCVKERVAGCMVLQWRHIGVTVVLQWCYSGITLVVLWCYSVATLCYSS
jgi:hypothetical protein